MPTKHEDVDANNYKTDHRTCCYDYLKIYMKLAFQYFLLKVLITLIQVTCFLREEM